MRPKAPSVRTLLAACLLLSMLSCAGNPSPPDTFHRLSIAAPTARESLLLPGVVEVDRLHASAVLQGRALAVVDAERPGSVRHASYDHWVDAPPALLQRALVSYLRAAGIANRVVTPEDRADPEWVISGHLERFERILGGSGGGALSVEFAVAQTSEPRFRFHRVYQVVGPAPATALASVDALGRAVEETFVAFVADVEAALAK